MPETEMHVPELSIREATLVIEGTSPLIIVYKWAHGTRGAPAQAVGETVAWLVEAHGGVCPPSALVEVARDEQHPCHRLFTWDDPKAAEAWRRHEARHGWPSATWHGSAWEAVLARSGKAGIG